MPWELPSFKLPSFAAGADLRTHQFKAVNGGAAEKQVVLADAGEAVFGILQNKPNTGEAAEIMNKGVTKAIAGASVTLFARVEVGTSGRLINLASGIPVGFALEAGAADEIITVLLV